MEDYENKTFAGIALENIYLKMIIDVDRKSATLSSELQGSIIGKMDTIKNTITLQNAIKRSEVVNLKNELNVDISIMKNDLTAENALTMAEVTTINNKINPLIGLYNAILFVAAAVLTYVSMALSKFDWTVLLNK